MNRTHTPSNSNSTYLDLAAYASSSQPASGTATSFPVSSARPNTQQVNARPTRSRQPSARARLVSELGASPQDLAEITRHEDPNAPDKTHQEDTDYGERRPCRGPARRQNANTHEPTSSLPTSTANNTRRRNPMHPSPTGPPPIASLGSSSVAPPQASTGNNVHAEPVIDPALLNLPPLHPPLPLQATSLPSIVQATNQVPTTASSVWSESSSPHGNLAAGNFQVPPQTPATWPPPQHTTAGHVQYSSPFGGPSPFLPTAFGDQSTQGASAVPTEAHIAHQPIPSDSPQLDSDDDDDVLGTLRNKTRKRCRRPIQLPFAVAPKHGSGLLAVEADPQNISSWPAQQRPLLLLARFEYGALVNTENGAPPPSALVRFQAEAYSRAIMSVSQSKRYGLPERPTPTILRCIHKHCSAFPGRVKDAAADAVVSIYKIQENCSSTTEVAAKVRDLLHNANFIFREITPEGRAGPWHHPAIASVIINSTFADREAEGILTKQRYLPLVPPPVIFLACTAIQHALEMWSSGTKVMQPFKFDITRRSNYQVYKRNWDEYLEQWAEEGEEYMKETRELLANRIRNVIDAVSEQGDDGSGGQSLAAETSFFSDTDAL